MALTDDDLSRIGGVVAKEIQPLVERVGKIEGRLDEHVRVNGAAGKRGLVSGIGGWLHGLRGWQRVVAIGILGAVVFGVVFVIGRLPGVS